MTEEKMTKSDYGRLILLVTILLFLEFEIVVWIMNAFPFLVISLP